MTGNRKDKLITIIILVIFAGLICLNFISYEVFEKRTSPRMERHNALEAWQQERLAAREATGESIRLRELTRNQDTRDIIEFDKEYSAIMQDYKASISRISEELEKKVVNIDELKDLADRRMNAAKRFRDSLKDVNDIPAPLEEFHDMLMDFLENDISAWQETSSYYSGSYSGDEAGINELHRKNSALYQQVIDLQKELYYGYGLEYLLPDQSP
jgi:hypothetical protein